MKYFVVILAVLVAGCAGTAPSSRVFSNQWADQIRHEEELKARGARAKSKSKDPRGTHDGARTGFPSRFENRRSGGGINIGGDSGLGGSLKKGGGTVQYKIAW